MLTTGNKEHLVADFVKSHGNVELLFPSRMEDVMLDFLHTEAYCCLDHVDSEEELDIEYLEHNCSTIFDIAFMLELAKGTTSGGLELQEMLLAVSMYALWVHDEFLKRAENDAGTTTNWEEGYQISAENTFLRKWISPVGVDQPEQSLC